MAEAAMEEGDAETALAVYEEIRAQDATHLKATGGSLLIDCDLPTLKEAWQSPLRW